MFPIETHLVWIGSNVYLLKKSDNIYTLTLIQDRDSTLSSLVD